MTKAELTNGGAGGAPAAGAAAAARDGAGAAEAPRPGAAAHASSGGLLRQPPAVWAITFACVVSYMGIGLVDPILPTIAQGLDATPGQTELLFTSYLFVTAIVMFFSAWVSSRFGVKRTLVAGLLLIILFAAGCSVAAGVEEIIGFRAGWGLGNALFVSTALAAIVASTAKSSMAIVLYEAAIGLGFAIGPMVGGLLGEVSWRGPFAGTAVLMALGLVAVAVFFRGDAVAPAAGVRLLDGVRGAADRRMAPLAGGALFYNFGFFMMLAYAPFPLAEAAHAAGRTFTPMHLGLVFFGWGLALAVSSVVAAPRIEEAFGVARVIPVVLLLLTLDMAAMAVLVHDLVALIALVIGGGLLLGVMNTLLTTASMSSTALPRPVASSAYSGVRFIGAALAPTLVGPMEVLGPSAPFASGAVACAVALAVLGPWAVGHARRSRVVLEPAA